MATITNSICTNGAEVDIQSATGNLNLGSASAANNIVIGNQTGSGATTIYSGSGGMILNPTSSFTVSAGSDIFIDGGSDMHIGTTVSNHTIAFGTASGKHINIGSNSATIQIFTGGNGLFVQTSNGGAQFDASAGGNFLTTGAGIVSISDDAVANTITVGTGAAVKAITIGSTNTTSSVTINGGSVGGGVNIATQTSATAIVIGNQTSSTSTTIYSGSGGVSIQPTSSFTVSAGSDVFIDSGSDMHIGTLVSSHAIAFGTASGKVITIGSTTATIGLTTGNGGFNVSTNNGGASFASTSTGGFFITGAGATSISDDATANTITIGTGAAVKSITIGSTNTTSSVTINTGSGGITIPSFTTTGALVSTASGVITDATASTTGFVLTSNGASTPPSFQAAGGGGGSFTWNNTTGSTQTMAVSNGYINNGSGTPTVFTLPSTATVGQNVAIIGANSGLWQIAQNSGQIINFNGGATTTGAAGTVSATSQYDTLFLMCVTANTTWVAYDGFGNYSIV